MDYIIKRGDVEEVEENGLPGKKWYLPHHGIYHTKKPEKFCVVFDCSAKHKGTSLNEHLMSEQSDRCSCTLSTASNSFNV